MVTRGVVVDYSKQVDTSLRNSHQRGYSPPLLSMSHHPSMFVISSKDHPHHIDNMCGSPRFHLSSDCAMNLFNTFPFNITRLRYCHHSVCKSLTNLPHQHMYLSNGYTSHANVKHQYHGQQVTNPAGPNIPLYFEYKTKFCIEPFEQSRFFTR